MMELLSKISTVAVSITAIITCICAICKPLRVFIFKLLPTSESSKELQRISQRISEIDKKVDNYEKQRLRREIMYYGNRCREGNKLTLETYRSLQTDFEAYKSLNGNGIVAEEWQFIVDYFNHQK